MIPQAWSREASASKPSMKCRKRIMRSFPTAWSLANVPPDDRLTLRPASEAILRCRTKLRFSSRTLCPLAASFRREDVVLGKAALLVERTFSTFAGNIPLLVVVCRSKATTRHVAVASHHQSPSSEMPPLLLEAHSWFSQFTQYEIVPNSHTGLKIDGYPWRSFSIRIHMISRARKDLRHSAVPPETRESVDDFHHDA